MNYYALLYELVEDMVTRRVPFREEHLRLAREAREHGELVLAGSLADPVDRALLVFHVDNKSKVEAFARKDPYFIPGLRILGHASRNHLALLVSSHHRSAIAQISRTFFQESSARASPRPRVLRSHRFPSPPRKRSRNRCRNRLAFPRIHPQLRRPRPRCRRRRRSSRRPANQFRPARPSLRNCR